MKKSCTWGIVCLCLMMASVLPAKEYNASLFGIKSDGITLNTGSIQRAIDFISEQGGGTLHFYVGRYLTGSIELKSGVSIRLEEGAALVAVPSAYDYTVAEERPALIRADGQERIAISGKGLIEGNGVQVSTAFGEQIRKGYMQGELADRVPALISLNNCREVKIEQIRLQQPATVPVVVHGCKEVTVRQVEFMVSEISAIRLSDCENIRVKDCFFDRSPKPVLSDTTSKEVVFEK